MKNEFYAVASNSQVLEISTNKAASLEGMTTYSKLGHKGLVRFPTDKAAYTAYSAGVALKSEYDAQTKTRSVVAA